MKDLLSKLNDPQREAVMTTDGAVLVIAGAGSGKTRALTHRVAYLIVEKKVRPHNILAVTFTNKAAKEMQERVSDILKGLDSAGIGGFPTIGTFHSVCVRILRREIEKIGYGSSFNIFDDQDQLSLMKRVMRELEIDPNRFRPQGVLGTISKAKNELAGPEEFASRSVGYWEETVSKIYSRYQMRLRENNALDFDDILMNAVRIFKEYPETLKRYQELFRYVMVDEYQDTNQAQYVLVRLLADRYGNICVVGDDWQGIYSWRGANIRNILEFEHDYPDAKVVKLEQNYRSTQPILDAAYGVISKNVNRKDKEIWTDNREGQKLVSYEARDEKDEARFAVREISKGISSGAGLKDYVVLYRTNAQSRAVEEALLEARLPYRIIGGVKFYQRKEIKDVLSYVRLIGNHSDSVSLARIINEPKRGIGDASLEKWLAYASRKGIDPISAGRSMKDDPERPLPGSKSEAISKFCEFIDKMSDLKEKVGISELLGRIFSESGYERSISDGTEESERRIENVKELLTVAKRHDEAEDPIQSFMEEVSLHADTDNIADGEDAVHLMTLHSAKGLEFDQVFIIGLEEGILPHSRSMLSESEMEEERRLMYVGITRAKKKVYLLFTRERNIFGSFQVNPPSRFIDDIPKELIEERSCDDPADSAVYFENRNIRSRKGVSIKEGEFRCGDKVDHDSFGKGTVVSVSGDIATVAFAKSGLKKISVSLAPMRKV